MMREPRSSDRPGLWRSESGFAHPNRTCEAAVAAPLYQAVIESDTSRDRLVPGDVRDRRGAHESCLQKERKK